MPFLRYKKITADALAELGASKDSEKLAALNALRAEMQRTIDLVTAERDEHLSNYTKVSDSYSTSQLTFFLSFVVSSSSSPITFRSASCGKSSTISS